MSNVNFEAMNIKEKYEEILVCYIIDIHDREEVIEELLDLHSVSKQNAKGYAEFCVICDRGKLPLIELDDYIKHYGC
tara:strand:+ start:196 stop:426 length:231 start_codon:yes stop_codon:yes gene_type:complete